MWPTAGLRGEQRRSPMTITASEDVREAFITGLRNAHAMEKQALSIMEPQVGRLESYPDVARRLGTTSARRTDRSTGWRRS
jgi:hypothetical protein